MASLPESSHPIWLQRRIWSGKLTLRFPSGIFLTRVLESQKLQPLWQPLWLGLGESFYLLHPQCSHKKRMIRGSLGDERPWGGSGSRPFPSSLGPRSWQTRASPARRQTHKGNAAQSSDRQGNREACPGEGGSIHLGGLCPAGATSVSLVEIPSTSLGCCENDLKPFSNGFWCCHVYCSLT